MKKMKGVLSMEPPTLDRRARLRHESLLQDFEDLQKETEAMRRKLQATKQKKLMLSAEVGFLRQRYQYLRKHPLPKPQPKQGVLKPQKIKVQAATIPKGRNFNRKESTSQPRIASRMDPLKERSSNGGVENTLQKTGLVLDLNQNSRNSSKKVHNSAPVLDLNHKDRILSGKEISQTTKKSIAPFFDLNQISREEEELQGNNEPMWIEEPKRSAQRVLSEEQHNDVKLSVCRNIGDGSSRAGKRKISWQDQVALRV